MCSRGCVRPDGNALLQHVPEHDAGQRKRDLALHDAIVVAAICPGLAPSAVVRQRLQPVITRRAILFGIAGLLAGSASVALGATGFVLGVLVVLLAAYVARDELSILGITLAGVGLGGLLTLSPTVIRSHPCTSMALQCSSTGPCQSSDCYAPLTVYAGIAYVAAVLLGLGIRAVSNRRRSRHGGRSEGGDS